ncbi:ribokinase [compost metagenome]
MSEKIDKLIAVQKVIAKDTTAAGDTFNGALAVAIADGMDIEQAVNFANKAASITTTKFGAQAAIPYLNDLKSF